MCFIKEKYQKNEKRNIKMNKSKVKNRVKKYM